VAAFFGGFFSVAANHPDPDIVTASIVTASPSYRCARRRLRGVRPIDPPSGASFNALKFSSETLDSFFKKLTMAQIFLSRRPQKSGTARGDEVRHSIDGSRIYVMSENSISSRLVRERA
jgi:hypothetical protein